MGVLILTHRRLLVQQFTRDLTTEGYGGPVSPGDRGRAGAAPRQPDHDPDVRVVRAPRRLDLEGRLPARHLRRGAHGARREDERRDPQLRRADLHRHDGDRAADREAGVGRLPRLGGRPPTRRCRPPRPHRPAPLPARAARRGRSRRCRSSAATTTRTPWPASSTTSLINQAAASLYRDRFGETPGIVYAAGVEHAYNLAREFRAAGLKAEAVSGKTPPLKLAETLAAYERGEINVLINAQLLAEGWNSPRATVCMHLAPTASRRVYQQRIGRIMRMHPRKEAGVVVDFVDPTRRPTTSARSPSTPCSTPTSTGPGARVTPAPRRRVQRRARRKLSPAPWLVPVTPDLRRRVAVITREWERVDPSRLADDEQLLWARIAGRQLRFDERQQFAEKLAKASRECREAFLMSCAAENPNRRLRLSALGDRVAVTVDRAELRRPRHDGHLGADVGEGPRAGRPHPPAGDRRGEGRRAGGDPLPLDVAARPRDAQAAGPARERRPAGGEAAPRRADELARAPARGERGAARQRRARAADPRRPSRCSRPRRPTRRPRSS